MSQKPVHEIRLGRIRAAIWVNHVNGQGSTFSTTISRPYKDGNVWRDSTAFYRDDLPIVAKIADMAYAWIWSQESPTEPALTRS
jgi:hypothetical protein